MFHDLKALFKRVSVALVPLTVICAAAMFSTPAYSRTPPGIRVASGPTLVASDIATSTTWTLTDSPYLVSVPVKVLAPATLTIEPGVEVQFLQDASLQIDGGLNAQGRHTQPITFLGSGATIQWQGLRIVQPAANITLQYVTMKQARVGVDIQPAAAVSPRVDISESLFEANIVGISANYSASASGPHLTLRNSLLTNNSIGVQIDSLPGNSSLVKLSSNSFVLNGIGIKAENMAQPGLKAERQWWGSASGPSTGDITYCTNDPPPNPVVAPPDVACGSVDFTPWSAVPAGRIILPNDKDGAITSTIGALALSDDLLSATSAVTLTIPAQSFSQAVDLVLTPRADASTLPGQPTALSFEVSAVANGQELHDLAAPKKITLQLDYVAADLTSADPQKLTVYSLQPLNYWSNLGITTILNTTNKRVFAQFDRLSRIRLTAVTFAMNWLALIQS